MSQVPPLRHVGLAALLATASVSACLHATGTLPSGPPPEYEETPIPPSLTSAATPTAPTTAPTPAPPASSTPVH